MWQIKPGSSVPVDCIILGCRYFEDEFEVELEGNLSAHAFTVDTIKVDGIASYKTMGYWEKDPERKDWQVLRPEFKCLADTKTDDGNDVERMKKLGGEVIQALYWDLVARTHAVAKECLRFSMCWQMKFKEARITGDQDIDCGLEMTGHEGADHAHSHLTVPALYASQRTVSPAHHEHQCTSPTVHITMPSRQALLHGTAQPAQSPVLHTVHGLHCCKQCMICNGICLGIPLTQDRSISRPRACSRED